MNDVALQVRAWLSDQRTACRAPRKFPAASERNGVQNWYTRPRCGLAGDVSTISQFLSSEKLHVPLRWATCGELHVRPPFDDVSTSTAVAEFGQGLVLNASTER